MRLLSIDTASTHVVCGIVQIESVGSGVVRELAGARHTGGTMHAEVLAPSIEQVAADAGVRLADLDGIVVGLGPGPFTGLRVGIVTAAAIGDALSLPVWGVCSLDALADDSGRTLVVSDARRKELYFAVYEGNRRLTGPDVAKPASLPEHVDRVERVVHTGAHKYLEELAALSSDVTERDVTASALVEVALRDGLVGGPSSTLQPIYIRRPDAAEPKPQPALEVTGPTLAGGAS